MAELQRGTVKWFNDAKGFGFIEHETGRDVFVHYSVIECEGFKTLKDGEDVQYELREGDKGLNASRVIRINPPPATKKAARGATTEAPAKSVASMIEIERDADIEDSTSIEIAAHEISKTDTLGH